MRMVLLSHGCPHLPGRGEPAMHSLQATPSQKGPTPGPGLAPSPLLSGEGPERWRHWGSCFADSEQPKASLDPHLYEPMVDLLHSWLFSQCPNQWLLFLVPSCHVGHTGLCLSFSFTPSSTVCSGLLPKYKSTSRKRDKIPSQKGFVWSQSL